MRQRQIRQQVGGDDSYANLSRYPPNAPKANLVRGLLDFLSYRALRLSGELSPSSTKMKFTNLLKQVLKS
jgi:hypothetical protein